MAQKPLRRNIKRHVPNIYLSGRDIAPRRRVVHSRGRELGDGDPTVDFLAGFFQGEKGTIGVLEGHKAITFRLSCGLIEDNYGLVEVAVGGKESAKGLGGGLGAEATDEELTEGRITIGNGADGVENVEVSYGGVLEDVDELVLSEGLEELACVFRGDGCGCGCVCGGGGRVVGADNDAVLFGLAFLAEIHGVRKEG